jgi:peptidoglycan/xylan/chitin deacetylase (PgdA/CDA1 family)
MASFAVRTLVLCYHSVSDEWEHPLAVTRAAFERQLSALAGRGLHPLGAADLAAGGSRGFHVTFDDAFRDLRDIVPLLERYGIRATMFASTAFAANGGVLDVPELRDEARAHPDRLATMTWDELRELADRGHAVESHTVTHPHLPQLSDFELERELRDSRAEIGDELGRRCTLLAYTYGEHDQRVQAAARAAGYEAAFALGVDSSQRNPYALPRVDLYRGDSAFRSRLKTSFVKPYASALLAQLRSRS